MAATLHIEEHIEKIDQIETAYDGFKYLKLLTDELGYEKFSVLTLGQECNQLSQLSLVNNWDAELLQVYDGENLAEGSPILQHADQSVRPLLFEIGNLPQDRSREKQNLSVTLFNDFKMQAGCCLPVLSSGNVRGVLNFSGRKHEMESTTQFGLQILGTYLFQVLATGPDQEPEKRAKLSVRERDCLTWTAAGKTTSEIALILELSEHTVNHYLMAAAKKLDAVNRVQSVAIAIRAGLLS